MSIFDPARIPRARRPLVLLIVLSTVPLAAQGGDRTIRGLVSNSLGKPAPE